MTFITYLFVNPGAEFNYYIPVLALASLMIVIAIFLKLKGRKDKACRRIFKNNIGNFITLGGITLILTGARYKEVPFISMRFLLGLTILINIYAIIKIIIKYKKNYKEYKSQIEFQRNKPTKKTYSHNKKKR